MRLRATDQDSQAGTEWTDNLATAAKDWVINALAERLALALIGALV